MKFYFALAVILSALLVTACGGMSSLQPSPNFSHQLSRQYQQLSVDNTRSSYKWGNSPYFTLKSQRASQRVDVQPENPKNWNVPREYRTELNNAYDMLQIALVPNKKKVLNPVPAANAQAYFDCWVEQAHKQWTPTSRTNDCRTNFYSSFCKMYNGRCSTAIDNNHIFRLYYAAGQTGLDSKHMKIAKQIAKTYKKGGNEIIVAGHTDRVGNPDTNFKTSLIRANNVMVALRNYGVPESHITVKAFGDKKPLVPTPHNVPNADNRRVLILIR